MLLGLIANFNQVSVMAGLGSNSAAATDGACHNFTIEWISQMKADGGAVSPAAASQRMGRLGVRNGAGNPVLQKAFGGRWAEGGSSYRLADEMMIMVRRLHEVELAFDYSPYDQAALVNAVSAPAGCGMIYSFWFAGSAPGAAGGAHTIGFYRDLRPGRGRLNPTSTMISCFDPNYGECEVPEADFAFWITHMASMYGPMLSHMMKVVDG